MQVTRINKSFSVKKKILSLTLVLAMLMLSGCGQEKKEISHTLVGGESVKSAADVLNKAMDGKVEEIVTAADKKLKEQDPVQYFMNGVETTNQMVICLGNGSLNHGSVYYYKKVNGAWVKQWENPCRVGENGFAKHTYEGDVTTPEGAYNLGVAFGNKSNPGTALEWFDIKDYHYWVDDPTSDYFNKLVDIRETPKAWKSAEHLIESPSAYNYSINIEVNPNCSKDSVSAIFLHCHTPSRGASQGCVAIDEEYMIKLLRDLQPGARMCIARDLPTLYSLIGQSY